MNFIKFWVSLLSPVSFSFGGGGGGGTQQSTGTTYNTNIPEYAKPYVETMLGATQKQLFDIDESNQITGFKPYQAYSTNAQDYVAPFSPMQQQAMQATGQLQTPGQIGQASGLAGMSGMGSLGAANQAMGLGQQYQRMATDPNSVQAYMSPYMQNVVDYQKSQALRDYGMGQGLRKAQSVGQGAFGGNRAALMESEAQRALGSQIGGIEAQGAQNAFQAAQQAQQFGSTMGLQGLQAGLQGYGQMGQAASTLGGLGAQQLSAQKDVIGLQSQMGAQQQAAEQQKINQAIQDWANTQQYPLMQLGVMSNMLRGLPMQSATTNQYVAAPNSITQGIGLAGAGASIYNALGAGKKEGGVIKMAKGGIAGYNIGGEAKSDLYDMPLDKLQKEAQESPSDSIRNMAKSIIRERTGKAGGGIIAFANPNEENNQGVVKEERPTFSELKEPTRNPNEWRGIMDVLRDTYNPKRMSPEGKAVSQSEYESKYVPDAATKEFESYYESARPNNKPPSPAAVAKEPAAKKEPAPAAAPTANRGVGLVPNDSLAPNIGGIKFPTAPTEESQADLDKGAAARVASYGINEGNQKARAATMAEKANSADEARRTTALRMAEFFGAWGSTPGNTIVAGLNALKNKVPDFIGDIKEEAKIRKQINKDIAELDKLDREEENGIKKDYFAERMKLADRAMHKYGYELTAASSRYSSDAAVRAASIRSAGAGGGEDKALNNLIGKRTEIEKAITNKTDKLGPITNMANMQDSKDPNIQARILDARAKVKAATQGLTSQLDQVNGLINTYKKVQGLDTGESNTAAPAGTIDFSKLPK